MFKSFVVMAAAISFVCSVSMVGAEERATKKEAEAMVKKAVAFYKKNGDKAMASFTAPSKAFAHKDLYITVYDLSGIRVAHGQNAKMAGKNMIGMKDSDGTPFIKERIEMAKAKGSFWQDYKFTDPLTKKIMAKSMYCEKADDKAIICGGIYKD
jgi:signal transduction histidine kinase